MELLLNALQLMPRGLALLVIQLRGSRARPHQILKDSHEIPPTLVEKLQDLLPVGLRLLGAMQFRQGRRVGSQNFAHCYARDSQQFARSRVCSLPACSVPES